MNDDDPFIDTEVLRAANARCDADLAAIGLTPRNHLRSSWNAPAMIRGKPLTDKQIEQYRKQGYYSEDFRAFRRERMQKKAKRSGNFVERDGKLIYSP